MVELHPPHPYIIWMAAAGLLTGLVVWLPLVLKRLPLSLPIVCVALGAAIFSLVDPGFVPLPERHLGFVERASEFVVLVALMGAGLKIDRVIGWRSWNTTWRLLGITMPLSIAGIAVAGIWGLGLSVGAAVLLGAVLAPTDPVLAGDIQVGPPRTENEDEARFALTSEAGLNDSLAFPFVTLGLLLIGWDLTGWHALGGWFVHDVIWEIGMGIAVGLVIGHVAGWIAFRLPTSQNLARTGDGVIALAVMAIAYSAAEMLDCYGFLAVFVAALALRHSHREHEFQREMYDLVEQVERLAMMLALILFGGALVNGLLAPLGWREVAFALATLLLVRPIATVIGLAGSSVTPSHRAVLAAFGIRGIGSVYYLSYAATHAALPGSERLWGVVGLIILLSVLAHGLTVTPVMRALDRSEGRDPNGDDGGEGSDRSQSGKVRA